MSQNHLNGFLEDVKGINPKFNKTWSCLRKLLNRLESQVKNPFPMHYTDALVLTGNDSRVQKYKPALQRLTSVWGRGANRPYPLVQHGTVPRHVDMQRICFRGDGRLPQMIFKSGFQKKNAALAPTYQGGVQQEILGAPNPVLNPMVGFRMAGDIDPDSAVCITPDISVASLFHLPVELDRMTWTYVYVVYVEKGYDTSSKQILDGLDGLKSLAELTRTDHDVFISGNRVVEKPEMKRLRASALLQNLYGRELATDEIPTKHIWYALKVQRIWNKTTYTNAHENGKWIKRPTGADYTGGGRSKIFRYEKNPHAEFPSSDYERAVERFIAGISKDIAAEKSFPLASTYGGYHESKRF